MGVGNVGFLQKLFFREKIYNGPEDAKHRTSSTLIPHHDVGFFRQSRMIQSIAEPMPPQPTPNHHLRLHVLAVDGCHISMALLWGVNITHINLINPLNPAFARTYSPLYMPCSSKNFVKEDKLIHVICWI